MSDDITREIKLLTAEVKRTNDKLDKITNLMINVMEALAEDDDEQEQTHYLNGQPIG